MESISKKTGRKFHGKFAATAVRIGIADPIEDKVPEEEVIPVEEVIPETVKATIPEVNEQGGETPALSSEKKADRVTEKAGTIKVPDKVNIAKSGIGKVPKKATPKKTAAKTVKVVKKAPVKKGKK